MGLGRRIIQGTHLTEPHCWGSQSHNTETEFKSFYSLYAKHGAVSRVPYILPRLFYDFSDWFQHILPIANTFLYQVT